MREVKRKFGERFVDDPALLSLYSREASFEEPAAGPLGIVYPVNEEEVAWLVKWAYENDITLYSQGSATSLSGNTILTKPGLIVSFEKMANIVEVNPTDSYTVVQPGIRIEELNVELARYGVFFPVDPGSVRSATIGGAIANGAGGMRGAKYGSMRDWVLGVNVVTGRGDLLKLGCRTLKCRNGYDLVRLIVGSEGTLGLVTQAVLRVAPLPESAVAVRVYYNDISSLVEDVVRIKSARIWPLFAEFMGPAESEEVGLNRAYTLFVGVDVNRGAEGGILARLKSALTGHIADEAIGIEEAMRLLEPRRRLFSAQVSIMRRQLGDQGVLVIEDVVVPVSKLPEAVRRIAELAQKLEVPLSIGGHVGDGNLHPTTWFKRGDLEGAKRARRFIEGLGKIAVELGGSVSAEHGIGTLKRELLRLELEPAVLEYMRSLKAVFDPKGILNPGKII
ncbi:FAD-binding oxidoreductase [Thermoproteus tenax]|uniref:D-lactate dehydrogenase (cytochrome) n=1 Tax=Thermoproteus tenax (strain ATCC 35583 / DSM 2078 / JCM 9277 / NBRC 100435 / Kra 1) TaxID=768679 RepID=G4RPF4_THETK|nr:FAD-linked oxidase C-terminal domain-containing protein [Thermoproteus tenax]CCC81449.1 D-lactate dehydrogenase [Thermoproteus tenax Kra 1]